MTDPNAYPATEVDVTADWLCRHLTRIAGRRVEQLKAVRADAVSVDGAYTAECTLVGREYAIIRLLCELGRVDPGMADECARRLWRTWADGGHIEETLREWAGKYARTGTQPPAEVAEGLGAGRPAT